MAAARKKLTVEVDAETFDLLSVLTRVVSPTALPPVAATVDQVLEHLVHSAADGIRRPGAWERGWVTQAFGDEWTELLEQDPETEWYRRPKAVR